MSTQVLPKPQTKVRDLCYIALMAALMAVCSWITVPFGPVPFTMQTFAIFAALLLLGGKRGTLAITLYLCLGLVGLPVFSGFNAGPGVLLGATGGYLVGFLAAGLLYWAMSSRVGPGCWPQPFCMLLVTVVNYAFGTVWFLKVYTGGGNAATLTGALATCVVPFILPGLVKMFLALVVWKRVGPYIH